MTRLDPSVIAMTDAVRRHTYPCRVRFNIPTAISDSAAGLDMQISGAPR